MRVVVALVSLLLCALTAGPAVASPREARHLAAEPSARVAPTALVLTVAPGFADTDRTAAVVLTDAAGSPLPAENVVVERLVAGAWQPVATLVTDPGGNASASVSLSRVPEDNTFRASYGGSAAHAPSQTPAVTASLVPRRSALRLRGPAKVVDDRVLTLRVRWRTGHGVGVAGAVRIQEQRGRRWRTVAELTTDDAGRGVVELRTRGTVTLRARAAKLPWVEAAVSPAVRVVNVPPAPAVRLPARAPGPRVRLPRQPRATGQGANVSVTPVPDAVWRSMVGRTWHAGCPVGRDGLRLVRANYVDFDGYRRRGELVVAAGAVRQFASLLTELHNRQVPIRSMYRVDRFGWSRVLRGADDRRSMAAGNTSAFNCRDVVGRPGVRSPHSYGRAFDLNPWENPYRVGGRWLPTSWWAGRSHPRVAWRSSGHEVVRILRRHGFAWTYGVRDAHHFDARTSSGRVVGRCAATTCH